jgi:hypothetical protein
VITVILEVDPEEVFGIIMENCVVEAGWLEPAQGITWSQLYLTYVALFNLALNICYKNIVINLHVP